MEEKQKIRKEVVVGPTEFRSMGVSPKNANIIITVNNSMATVHAICDDKVIKCVFTAKSEISARVELRLPLKENKN